MASSKGVKRKKPAAWDTTKAEFFVKWDAIKGEQIPKETLEFFIHVKEKLHQPFEDTADRDLFIHNVFSQTNGMESALVRNSLSSQVMEQLLAEIDDSTLLAFAAKLQPQLSDLCRDPFACHVLQALLLSATLRLQAGSVRSSDLEWLLIQAADALMADLVPLALHVYGSHVLRTCLECLAGFRFPQLGRSRSSQEQRWRDSSEEEVKLSMDRSPITLIGKLVQMTKAVKNCGHLRDGLSDPNFSILVQLLLRLLHARSMERLAHKLVKRLSKLGFGDCAPAQESDPVPEVFYDGPRLRALETTLAVCDEPNFCRLQRKYFSGRLLPLLTPKLGSMAVQRLVEACPKAELLEEILDELEPDKTAAWWTTTRLPIALADACVRLFSQQARFTKMAARLVDCKAAARSGDLVCCLLYRTSFTQWQNIQASVNSVDVSYTDGSRLLQAMLKFSKPTRLINSVLDMELGHLSAMLHSQAGSWVMDSLMSSPHMSHKNRNRLLGKIRDELVPLAGSKGGSRSVGAIWTSSSVPQKTFIAEVLSPFIQTLQNSFYGGFAVRNFALPLFVKKRADWTAYVKREANKRKMFADLLPTSTGGSSAQPAAGAPQKHGGSTSPTGAHQEHGGPPPPAKARKKNGGPPPPAKARKKKGGPPPPAKALKKNGGPPPPAKARKKNKKHWGPPHNAGGPPPSKRRRKAGPSAGDVVQSVFDDLE